MSWSLFKTKYLTLTGRQHVTTELFARTIATAYDDVINLHFDSMTAGGKVINSAPKLLPFYQGILSICTQNLNTHNDVMFLQQIGIYVQAYWAGIIIVGPTGTSSVLSSGIWTPIPVKQNFNVTILLDAMIMCFRNHIMTLTGLYVSSVIPGVSSPWSGASLQTLP